MMNHRRKRAIALAFVGLLACVGAAFAGQILKTGKALYSQGNEELAIRDFFSDKKGYFFLDIGCSDYKEFSTTYYLEKHLGWKGIGVDALGEYADDYKKYRPNTKFLNYIVADKSGGAMDIIVNPGQKSLSTIMPEVAGQFFQSYKVPVPIITLNDLLKKQKVKRIDFLSMDIEDSEPIALAGFDIKKYRVKFVCIEAHDHVRQAILDYFTKNGYELIQEYSALDVGQNWYFKPRQTSLFDGLKSFIKKLSARPAVKA
jgi:FkbM family methyltransferase